MKKILLILLFAFPVLVSAQVFNASAMRIGVSSISLTLNPTFVNTITAKTGVGAPSQVVSVTGRFLTTSVIFTAVSGSRISVDGSTWSTTTVTYTPSGGNVDGSLYISSNTASIAGHYTGNITGTSTGATTVNIPVDITISASNPTNSASPNSYSGGTTVVGNPGSWQTSLINGINLTTDDAVTSPAGWELSFDGGVTNVSSGTIHQSGGTITNFVLSYRLTGASIGSPSGNISISSTGATTINIAVSGTVTSTGTPTDTLVFQGNANALAQNVPNYMDMSIPDPGPAQAGNISFTDDRNYRGITLTTIGTKWTGGSSPYHSSSNTSGYAGSSIVPNNVGLSLWFNYFPTGTFGGQTVADTNIRISKLDPTQVYHVIMYAADGTTLSCGARYINSDIYDSTNHRQRESIDFNVYHNTNNFIEFYDVVPDANGNFWIGIWPFTGGNAGNCSQYGELGSIQIYKQVSRHG